MLEDLSQHLLDIAENGVAAGAGRIDMTLEEDREADRLTLTVEDDGRGMDEEFLARVADPFTTTRTTRRVGLGIPFLKQSAELCGGGLTLRSAPGRGTRISAAFRLSSIDRPPLGDLPATVATLLAGNPRIHWIYRHRIDGREYLLDSAELLEVLEDPELFRTPDVCLWVRESVREGIEEIRGPEGQR